MATFFNDCKENRVTLLQRGFCISKGPVDVAEVVNVDSVDNLSENLNTCLGKFEGLYVGKSVTVLLNDAFYGFYHLASDGTWKRSEEILN